MRVAAGRFSLAALLCCIAPLLSQASALPQPANAPIAAEVSFQFERQGLPVPRFTLRLQEDGTGTYQADQAAQAGDSWTRGEAAQHVQRTLKVSSATATKIFQVARDTDRFNIPCASTAKNIADMGTKTLRYSGPDGSGSCTFNYSENKTAMLLTNLFQGIARTLDEGRRLDFLHRYDRLGLDAEMSSFSQELADGRAVEPGMIAPTLSAIADDTAVIQRVRQRAARMLQQAQESR
jgi:hypothetical protein